MCGIIGYIGDKNAVQIVLDGLKRLEYRGYDSAGIACIIDGSARTIKCKGKITQLESLIDEGLKSSQIAIGHTRWATHGKPSDENAHPHSSGAIVLVHNGIIENYRELKNELEKKGYKFVSETDTEVIAHLIDSYSKNYPFEEAVKKAVKRLKGSFAIVILNEKNPDTLIGIRKESPLVVGISGKEKFVASDIPAFLNYCKEVIFLDDEELAVLKRDSLKIYDFNGIEKSKSPTTITWTAGMAEKGGFKHFMLKEIYEQPRALSDTIAGRVLPDNYRIVCEEFGLSKKEMEAFEKIYLVACGTSYHACLAGEYIIEEICGIPAEADIASEFRYKKVPFEKNSLFVVITQSGETADSLAALKYAKNHGIKTLSICNVLGSTASREADAVFYTHSGPEIGVASTKAFTSQILALYLLSIGIAQAKNKISKLTAKKLIDDIFALPGKVETVLKLDSVISSISKEVYKKPNFLYLGRGINYPIALEGALKLKEISYIHAEGYPAGEMKHGPIALVEEGFPVVFVASDGHLLEKTISNMQEIKARDGFIITLTDNENEDLKRVSDRLIKIEGLNSYLNTILFTVPLQLLAYHIAVLRGCDVDQPRNLAKSVTVE